MKFCNLSKRKWPYVLSIIFIVVIFILLQPLSHFNSIFEKEPDKESIHHILDKKVLTKDDHRILFEQTGLSIHAIEELMGQSNYDKKIILEFQEALFREREIWCRKTSWVTRQDRVLRYDDKQTPLAPVQKGDILLSFSSHTLGWRHGHGGIVTDDSKGKCLEAVVFGSNSKIVNLNHWKKYSDFMILRLKNTGKKERAAIADYARGNLTGIPYGLVSGILGEKNQTGKEKITAQCAYLIWYAFQKFGYDLDGDGGKLVTVKDLTQSSKLEVIQIFKANIR